MSEKWNQKIAGINKQSNELTKNKKLEYWLCDAKPEALEEWRKLVTMYGFKLNQDEVKQVQALLTKWRLRNEISNTLKRSEKKALWKRTFLENPSLDIKMKMAQ